MSNFSPFAGAVEKVSSTAHMEELYNNMTTLFETFTKGALIGQGANSEILLRTIYRSLNNDFLRIIQDGDAVNKIAQNMRDKQSKLTPENLDKALVPETTKKVVKGELDINDCNIMDVVMDFVDELQTSILQVRMNLNREYERRKMIRLQSYEGQQQDIDRLTQGLVQQNDDTSNRLETMDQGQSTWEDESLESLRHAIGVFNQLDSNNAYKDVVKLDASVKGDKNLQNLAKPYKFNIKTLADKLNGLVQDDVKAQIQLAKMKKVKA